jgi:hypothetical protein
MTNLPLYSATADAIQLRPFEVLCEVGVAVAPLRAAFADSVPTLHQPSALMAAAE